MNIFKRSMAMFLALCMLIGVVPMTAFAEEIDGTVPIVTEQTEELEECADEVEEGSEIIEEIIEEPAEEIEEITESVDNVAEDSDLAAETLVLRTAEVETQAETSNKPADGKNASQPFPMSIIGSGHYRIPALLTTNDGTLVAAADARWHAWDTTDDNGDIDTIVSRSDDNGENWNYTFANYIDNGNTTDYGAATFIDPALAYDGEKIYMIVDLYPGQSGQVNCTATSKAGTGYDNNGNLLLSKSAGASNGFNYYLSEGKIVDATGNDQGYTVDAWFHVKDANGNSCGNLFDYDNTCGFYPLLTSHLYLTTSSDNGATWSAPMMLNSQVKGSSNSYYLVSPGRGIVTSDGTIIFGAYDNSNQASLIYSKDGVNWERSANSGFTSSENEIVELSNGTLRMFYRYGYSSSGTVKYVDITKNDDGSYSWGSPVSTTALFNGNVNISAISYSKTVDGKQVILVSCPADVSGQWNRYNGKIYTFTFDGTNMELVGTYDVDNSSSKDAFSYSCLTELADGSIGMLYEKGDSGNITYINPTAETVTGLVFDAETPDEGDDEEGVYTNVAVSTGGISIKSETKVTEINGLSDFVAYDVTLTKDGVDYVDSATITIPLEGKFAEDVELWGFVVEADNSITYVKEAVRDNVNDTLTFTAPHFSVVGGTPAVIDDEVVFEDKITSNGSGETAYVLDTDGTLNPDTTYLIVNTSADGTGYALTKDGDKSTSTAVEISNGIISGRYSENVEFTISNAGIKSGMTYLNSSNSSVIFQTGDVSVKINSKGNGAYNIKMSSWYALYCQNGEWKTKWTSSTDDIVYLYEKTSGAPTWTIDAALQESRIFAATIVTNDGYTDDSWTAYQSALNAAKDKLAAVEVNSYNNENAATAALDELIAAVDALEAAKNALVNTVQITINYKNNGQIVATEILDVNRNNTVITLPKVVTSGTVSYTVDNTTLTLIEGITSYDVAISEGGTIYVTAEDSPVIGGTGYEGVRETDPVSGLIITSSTSFDLNLKDSSKDVIWGTTSDKITVDQNGTVTGVAATDANEKVYVKAIIDGITYMIPVTVLQAEKTAGNGVRTVHCYSSEVSNCTAYYSYQCGDLVEFPKGTQLYIEHDISKTDIITFFATPNEGYALTFVSSSGGSYFHAVQNEKGTSWGYEKPDTNSVQPEGGYMYVYDQLIAYVVNGSRAANIENVKYMLTDAVKKKCDGSFFFSRAVNAGNISTSTVFVAEKLPEVYKILSKVSYYDETTGETVYASYNDDMNIGLGYTLHYTIYVTIPTMNYTGSGLVEYTEFEVDDPLTGHAWTADLISSENVTDSFVWQQYEPNGTIKSESTITVDCYESNVAFVNSLNDGEVHSFPRNGFTYVDSNGKAVTYSGLCNVYAFNTSITLSASNFLAVVKDGKVTNTAEMMFKHHGTYAKGLYTADSNAAIEATVVVPEYVIDFGLPVIIDLKADPLVQGDKITSAVAKYGEVELISDHSFKYTPTKILEDPEFIMLTFNENVVGSAIKGYGVRIYPATTVFYEEGFAFNQSSSDWSNTGYKGNDRTQVEEKLGGTIKDGKKVSNYGYDGGYITNTNVTGALATKIGAKTSFTFTGNGIQVFANCAEGSGAVAVQVKNSAGKYVNVSIVDTAVGAGNTDATNGQTGDMNSLPIVSLIDLQNMPHDTYTVILNKVVNEKPVYIDGIRIFNTMKDSNVFAPDWEDNPDFYEMRDAVLNAVGVNAGTSADYKTLCEQIYNGVKGASALITDEAVDYADSNTIQDLLDKGPKNELFLYVNQTLNFKVKTNRVMQIGMKAPQGATTADVSVSDGTTTTASNQNIASSVDMFYTLAGKADSEKTYEVQITNTGSKILSITELKICDDPNATFVPLTLEDIQNILKNDGTEEPSAPETPVKELTITKQPSNGEAKLGERYMVEVQAEGEGLKYQWYFRKPGATKWSKSGVTDNTYDDVMTKARADREVYCVITDANGNKVTTDIVKLICIPGEELAIVKQPVNGEAVLGERYCVTVEAKGEGLKYQWYFRNAGSEKWSKSGVCDNTYDDVMTKARAGREVYCVITDAYGNKVTTEVVKLVRVEMQLEILSQPADVSVSLDEEFCVVVEAKGEGLKYQWYFRNAGSEKWNKSSVRDNTYDDVMTKARANREVYCVITDQWGNSVTTDIAKLILVAKEELKLLGQSYQSAAMGGRYCVTVDAQGEDLKYQWYFRNAGSEKWSKSGVRDNTYDDVMNKSRANREVYCVITDACGNQIITDVVTLTVEK